MRHTSSFIRGVSFLVSCAAILSGCASGGKKGGGESSHQTFVPDLGLKPLTVTSPMALKLKADVGRIEKVDYFHQSRSRSFEDMQLRHQKDESLEFTSQAETLKQEPQGERFTQHITVTRKEGNANLHDFAMPEVGEKLEIVADSTGKILKAGDYPDNSIFFVPPISLPNEPVSVGDTWTLQANWLSLEEMLPYQLDMVSILKGFVACGEDRCADIEISGEVLFQGPLAQVMRFRSEWRGRLYFALNAGTVLWSRVDSEEQFIAENVHREVKSCLEARLNEPSAMRLTGFNKPACDMSPQR